MMEYESLHAEHQSLEDTNLEEQKARTKESEQAVLEVWEDIKKTTASISLKIWIILITPVYPAFDENHKDMIL